MSIPYLLFASPPIGNIAARHLANSAYPPAAVVTDTTLTTDEQVELVYRHKAGFILVVGYGRILKRALLDSVAGQVLNIHPSLLPLYRGPAPVVQAMLDGVHETGVSLMEIDTEMDHGPLLAQETVLISGKESRDELYEILTYKGVQLFLEHIEDYLSGELEPQAQDHFEASYTRFIKKEDGKLNPEDDVHSQERQIRAFQGWPGSWVELDGKRLIIHSAHIEHSQLVPDSVQPENGTIMTFAAFCAGRREKPQDVLQKFQ